MNKPDLDSKSIALTIRCNLSPYNELIIVVEETYTEGEYSILAYDEMGDIWEEKFSNSIDKAKKIADKLFDKYTKH